MKDSVQIGKFSIGAGTTAVLMPKRLFLALRRQLEKLDRRLWTCLELERSNHLCSEQETD